MTLPAPRVVIVDDNPEHLRVLADGLYGCGVACLPVHFTGDGIESIPQCPHVRVLFADLHLVNAGAGTTNVQHFTTIVSLIEATFAPTGPYAVVLWTQYPEEAEALRAFLEERLVGVSKPFAVVALNKVEHLEDNRVKDAAALVAAVRELFAQRPQIAALFNWEERVHGAAAATVSAVIDLAIHGAPPERRQQEIARILYRLAYEAVGEGNVDADRFRAVNEALLPILADRIASLKSDPGAEGLWQAALAGQSDHGGLTVADAAKLNRLVNLSDAGSSSAADRGAVAVLPQGMLDSFEAIFGLPQDVVAKKELICSDFVANDPKYRWMLVQVQAVCDFAQSKSGPLPYVLALEMPFIELPKKPPAAVAQTPAFDLNGQNRTVRLNTRFLITKAPAEARTMALAYRLREGLINEFGHHLHTQGNRPGMITFRERPARPMPVPAAPPVVAAQPAPAPPAAPPAAADPAAGIGG